MGNLVGGANAILLLLTVMAVGASAVIAFLAHRRRKSGIARTFFGGAAAIALLYTTGVIAASATSTEQTIEAGDIKWFCGFYLDCHLGISVERSEKLATMPTANGALKAAGSFHVLTVRLHNSAKNPNIDMLLYQPKARIVDALGRVYERSTAAESALAPGMRSQILGAETKVGHTPVDATMVFDLPQNIQRPRLDVSEGWIVDRIIELGLIADENSILHKRALLAIDGSTRTASDTNE